MKQASTLSTTNINDLSFVEQIKTPSWVATVQVELMKRIRKLKELWQWFWGFWVWRAILQFFEGLFTLLFEVPPAQEHIDREKVKAMQYRGVF